MTIKETQQDIIDEFAFLGDWQERYAHIIDLGRSLTPMDPAKKTDAHKVKGCQSQVWLDAREQEGKIHFEAESDALIVQGLIAILMRVYNDRTPQEIVEAPLDFLEEIGLMKHLSQSRTNGLHSMLKTIRAYALGFLH